MEIVPNWHPVFVHFTVALLTLSVVFYVVCFLINRGGLNNQCAIVARWNLWAGTALTLGTVVTGWYAFNTVIHDDPSHTAMTNHRNWALMTATVFVILTVWSIRLYRKHKAVHSGLIVGLIVGAVLLGGTAWRGGELVFRHGLGVMSLPQANAEAENGHAHGHDVASDKAMEQPDNSSPIEEPSSHSTHDHAH